MRILVCGGRDYDDKPYLDWVLGSFLEWSQEEEETMVIIQGEARGADLMAKEWAITHGVQHLDFPADWAQYGKRAGYLRNAQMLAEGKPDLVIPFPGGKGTRMMVKLAKEAGVEVLHFDKVRRIKHRS